MKIIKKVRAPVRIDFGGGTTDIEPFASKYGGAVLNAAINKYIIGRLEATDKKVGLEYHGNIPTSSGLGTSGVMNLVWLSLISQTKNKIELAEKVYALEQSLGLTGGKQDQYTAALGGINFLEFSKDMKVKITPLKLDKKIIKELENHLIIVYVGEHFSSVSNNLMIQNLKRNKQHLINIRNIAKEMKTALLKKDLERFIELINEETKERGQLSKYTITPKTKRIIKKAKQSGAIAAKILGSGGGGSVLFYGNKFKLKKIFKDKAIEFKFDWEGLRKI